MNTTAQSQIYEILYDHRQEIAATWLYQLKELTPVAAENAELPSRLALFTEQLLSLLVADTFEAEAAQKIGAALDVIDNLQPEDIAELQKLLSQELTCDLNAEQIASLHPRLVQVLSAMTTGFFVGKAKRAKTFNMNAMSRMGHDLKTPINAITGFSRVILKGIDGPITEFQQQDLTSIFEAGKKLLTMIDDTFEVAKSDAAETQVYTVPFDAAALLGDVLRTVQPLLAKKGHNLEIQCVGELGNIRADPSMVRWLLLSILLHVARLAEKQTISLIAMREVVQDVDYFVFETSAMLPDEDTGEVTDEISESVIQGDEDIGLITCNRFCDELGGNLVMTHTPDGLAKFSIQLPAR